jgi:hypothetical protein
MAITLLLMAGPALVGVGLGVIRAVSVAVGLRLLLAGLALLATGVILDRRPR